MIVTMRGYQLDVGLILPDEFHNISLSGLFGNFNGNPLDDLASVNGETINANSSEEVVYKSFGETCELRLSVG
jgi:hypothetical protein